MSTMTKRQAWQPRRNAAVHVGAYGRQRSAAAFARDMVCVVALSKGMTGIGGTSETGRAFLSGDDT